MTNDDRPIQQRPLSAQERRDLSKTLHFVETHGFTVHRRRSAPLFVEVVIGLAIGAGLVVLILDVAHRLGPAPQSTLSQPSPTPYVHGPQLDLLYRTDSGRGTMTSAAHYLPAGRYTFFAFIDGSCVTRIDVIDRRGATVAAANETVPGIQLLVIVQRDLTAGDYALAVTATRPECGWSVQEILNSLPLGVAPPRAQSLPTAPEYAAMLNAESDTTTVPTPGLYKVTVTVHSPVGVACTYAMDMTGPDGIENVAHPGATGEGSLGGGGMVTGSEPMYLEAGFRQARVEATCEWSISITPWIGTDGGGVQGFAQATSLAPLPSQ